MSPQARQNLAWMAGAGLALVIAALPVAAERAQPVAAPAAHAFPAASSIMQGSAFAVDRFSIGAGGGSSAGGIYRIAGSVGQATADPLGPASGGIYGVTGGYWAGTPLPPTVFVNGFEGP